MTQEETVETVEESEEWKPEKGEYTALKGGSMGHMAGATDVGENDTRTRRVANAKTYMNGVAEYRLACAAESADVPSLGPSTCNWVNSRTFLRVRPLFEHETDRGEWNCASLINGTLVVHEGFEKMNKGAKVKALRHRTFPKIEPFMDDESTYEGLKYLVREAIAGGLTTLFMLGMTGSGKTYCTNIIHSRAPRDLFAELPAGSIVKLTCFEILGKRCFDLCGSEPKQEVQMRVGEDGATHARGVTERVARDPEELQELLQAAVGQREVAATGTNATSSRSHAVYRLQLENGGSYTVIDLAGNEGNLEMSQHSKKQMEEAAEINGSHSALRACLHARAVGSPHVPFRESVLTRVLRDPLTKADATTAVLSCLSPACTHLELTLRTLKSAMALMGDVKEAPAVESILKEYSVQKGGPSTWDRAALVAWLEEQPFGSHVTLPDNVTGPSIMKVAQARLAPFCGGDKEVAQELFTALRVASKEAAARDLQQRREIKSGAVQAQGLKSKVVQKRAPINPAAVQ
ncbi:hypothetical protein CYMTET_19373 [Cymbomonas tetramitiformis]|uniref:Kinesin motor domain-containing protein n=1 Tax=Cymbomonas tetramitiformis TaxID=36881 RepID=A0AAE0L5D1_9CHLO|nr:hypothetical protein CYMTET_19373 [Cymbomonas tetramitiformis]